LRLISRLLAGQFIYASIYKAINIPRSPYALTIQNYISSNQLAVRGNFMDEEKAAALILKDTGLTVKEEPAAPKAEDIKTILDVIRKEIQNLPPDKIALPTQSGIDFYELQSIIRCEAQQSYCMFYLDNMQSVLVSRAIGEYEEFLTARHFMRVHRSHVINLRHVMKYIRGEGGQVLMKDGKYIDVARSKKAELMKQLLN